MRLFGCIVFVALLLFSTYSSADLSEKYLTSHQRSCMENYNLNDRLEPIAVNFDYAMALMEGDENCKIEKNPALAVQIFHKYVDSCTDGNTSGCEHLDHAMFGLGEIYKNGEGVPKDYNKAFEWYKKTAAIHEDIWVDLALADSFYFGMGTKQNHAKALEWYLKAIDAGREAIKNDPTGELRTKERYSDNLNKAWRMVALMYMEGLGTQQDAAQAAQWYTLAADEGDTFSQGQLGYYYKDKEDYVTAAKWFLAAAKNGDAGAQGNIGYFYYQGTGVPKNYIEAYAWLTIAAAAGIQDSNKLLGIIKNFETQMTRTELIEAQRRAKHITSEISTH